MALGALGPLSVEGMACSLRPIRPSRTLGMCWAGLKRRSNHADILLSQHSEMFVGKLRFQACNV